MKRKNRLNEILSEFGLEHFKPTDFLLEKLDMKRRRFYQILKNEGKHEITLLEKENLENWLSELTNLPVDKIQLMENSRSQQIMAKHRLS